MRLCLLAFLLFPVNAHAATFVVDVVRDTVDADPGDGVCLDATGGCSVRAAVMEANAWPGADIVDLPAGGHRLTAAGPGEEGEDLDVLDELTIRGAGKTTTWISGESMYRVLLATGAALTVEDMSLVDGAAVAGEDGGAVYADTDLTLTRVGAFGGTADNGGCIYAAGHLILDEVTAERCTARLEGAVLFTSGSADMSAVVMRDNVATDGFYVAYAVGPADVVDSLFENHDDTVITSESAVSVARTVFSTNRVAVGTDTADVTLTEVSVVDGEFGVGTSDGALTVTDSTFLRSNNTAVSGSGPSTAILGSRFIDNDADDKYGELVEASGGTEYTIDGCSFVRTKGLGSALSVGGASATVMNSVFRDNDQALTVYSDDAVVSNTVITGSTGMDRAVEVPFGTVTFTDVTIRDTEQAWRHADHRWRSRHGGG